MSLTFFSRSNFFWYTVPQWCWGLEELTKHKTKIEEKIVMVDIM